MGYCFTDLEKLLQNYFNPRIDFWEYKRDNSTNTRSKQAPPKNRLSVHTDRALNNFGVLLIMSTYAGKQRGQPWTRDIYCSRRSTFSLRELEGDC